MGSTLLAFITPIHKSQHKLPVM